MGVGGSFAARCIRVQKEQATLCSFFFALHTSCHSLFSGRFSFFLLHFLSFFHKLPLCLTSTKRVFQRFICSGFCRHFLACLLICHLMRADLQCHERSIVIRSATETYTIVPCRSTSSRSLVIVVLCSAASFAMSYVKTDFL